MGRACRVMSIVAGLGFSLAVTSVASADEVVFLNGDRLTGTIVQAARGKLTMKTESAGTVTIDLAKVKTFATDAPVAVRLGDKTVITSPVMSGPAGSIRLVPVPGGAPQPVALRDVTQINPPPVKWTGSVSANGLFTTGNSETATIGIAAGAVRRGERDRITLGAGYLYGRQRDRDTDESETTERRHRARHDPAAPSSRRVETESRSAWRAASVSPTCTRGAAVAASSRSTRATASPRRRPSAVSSASPSGAASTSRRNSAW